MEPAGFHLVPLPFADDIRAAPDQVLTAARGRVINYPRIPLTNSLRLLASDELKDLAAAWVRKLAVKHGAYPLDSYPNPGKLFANMPITALTQ